MLRAALIPLDAARAHVRRALGVSTLSADVDLRPEILRAVIWSLTLGESPAHVLRVLNRATAFALATAGRAPDAAEIRLGLRDALNDLADAGDVVELSRGMWLPAPCRAIPIGAENEGLLVGGIPSAMLPEATRIRCRHHGVFRHFPDVDALIALGMPPESWRGWARMPEMKLQLWAAEILGMDISPYATDEEGAPLQFYLPAFAPRHSAQFRRWGDPRPGLSGRHLARRRRVFGLEETLIVEARAGRVVAAGAQLSAPEARRLMYALDSAADNPTRVRWVARSGKASLAVVGALPRPEQRLLGALGRRVDDPDRPFERRWLFERYHQLVLDRLHALDVDVQVDQPARSTR